MQGRRRISSALLAVVTTVAGLVAAAPQAHADGTLINDIDCDGTVDYAVGVRVTTPPAERSKFC